jgi:hypothetical protein
MGKHYLPRYYLRGFTRLEGEDEVYLYQRGRTDSINVNIINVGQENRFYSDEIETQITQEVEEKANPILGKIRNKQFPSVDEKLMFSRYMYVTYQRVPKRRKLIQGLREELWLGIAQEVDRELLASKKIILKKLTSLKDSVKKTERRPLTNKKKLSTVRG